MKEKDIISIPVTVLTGFLGTGKTTFLNHLLRKNEHIRYAVIENEFGEEGIDNELALRPDDTIIELNNGCLCCTLNDNLYDILNELYERRHEFDEIIIEATGVADPIGLAQPLITHPLIKKHFPLTAVICLVDAELMEDQLDETIEAIRQITFSDILLINKIDLVREDYVAVVENRLRQLNPLATILKGNKGQFPEIDYHHNHKRLEGAMVSSKNGTKRNAEQLDFPTQKQHGHHHHDHTEDINSHTFIFDHSFDYQVLFQQLFVYLTFQAKGLYRMKGLVWLENKDHQYVLQSVGQRLDFREHRVWKPTEQKRSVIVFIGKNLQRSGLEKMLNRCFSIT